MTELNQATLGVQTAAEDDDEISLLDLLQVVADNLRLLILGPLVAGLLALGYSFTIAPTFTATTKFLPPQQQASGAAAMLQSLGALGGLAGAATGLKNPSDQYLAFMQSRSVQDALIDRFKLMERATRLNSDKTPARH
jgi:tyrosine-protein kinase Etk/Wzc